MSLTKKAVLELQTRGFREAEGSARGVANGMDEAAGHTERATGHAHGLGRALHEVGHIVEGLAVAIGATSREMKELQGVFNLGAAGVQLGSHFGPIGAAIGGVVGAGIGFAKGSAEADAEEKKKADEEAHKKLVEALKDHKDALKDNTSEMRRNTHEMRAGEASGYQSGKNGDDDSGGYRGLGY